MTDKHRPSDWPSPSEFIQDARARGAGLLGPQARVTPYVGIAGFMTPEEVRSVAADAYTLSGFGTPRHGGRRLAIGALVSWKTLNGRPPGQPSRYPQIGDLRAILDAAAAPYHNRAPCQPEGEGTTFDLETRCLRIVHYNTKEPGLARQLDRICEAAGAHLDGFQLNVVWPDPSEVRAWAQDHPTMRVILQVNRAMFSNVARNPQLLTNEIGAKYVPWITDVLFDMSGGTGASADLAEAETVLASLYGAFGGAAKGGIGIGLAGGLHWQNVADLARLFDRWPDLSIDAEGRLRDKQTDALNCELAREYARRALGVMPDPSAKPKTTTTP